MRRITVCCVHPNKPANKKCRLCGDGYCKIHTLKTDAYGQICDRCGGPKQRRGVMKIVTSHRVK